MNRYDQIENCRKELVAGLTDEQRRYGGYEEWYAQLGPFRDSLKKYIRFIFKGKYLKSRITLLPDLNILDHHVLGYFAPLKFVRKGIDETNVLGGGVL